MTVERRVRRVVTGHDANGLAVIVSDDLNPHIRRSPHRAGVTYHNIWTTNRTPAPVDSVDPVTETMSLVPPPGGCNFRLVEFGPERDFPPDFASAAKGFAELGKASSALVSAAQSRHPGMHRTQSLDYGIVLEGEIWLLLDEEETLLRRGDICIQQATNHAWSNRSDASCLMAFVLIDAVT